MLKRFIIPLILLVCGVAGGLVLAGRMKSADEVVALPQSRTTPASATTGRSASLPSNMPDFSAVAERAVGGVTNIASTRVIRTQNSPFASDPFFRYFFGDQDDMFGYRNRIATAAGSGVIVSPDGYVLTNNHVVANAVGNDEGKVTVTFGTHDMPAQIVGVDELTDLALLKVANVRDLPTLPWGDSSQLKLAEWVLAIGNPFSIGQTVTLGIVSATKRNLQGQISGYEDFIQTDAAINPGNSGGALINARGELVGINSAIYSETGGYQGIGFAIPSNLARRIMTDLQRYGMVRRGSIGRVDVTAMTPQLAQETGARDTKGALVYQMARTSEAYAAGIRPGDVIVSFNNQPVDDPSQFLRLLSDAPIGSTAKVGIIRDGRRMDISVKINAASRRRQ